MGISVTLGSGRLPPYTPPPVGPRPPGTRYFSFWKELPELHGVSDAALEDLDGDGDLDIVVAGFGLGSAPGSGPETAIWLNDGTGGFQKSSQTFSDNYAVMVACSHVDGDGDMDILLLHGSPSSSSIQIWLNRGDGTFDFNSDIGQAHTFALGDVDADGYDDLVATSSTAFTIRANDKKGGFGKVLQSEPPDGGYHRPVLADLDGDGDLDLVVMRKVWLNDGEGKFAPTGQIFDRDTRAVAAADIDGDGDADLILGNYDQPNDVYNNDGKGVFTKSGDFVSKPYCTTDIALVDFDEDGDLDLVEANLTASNLVSLNEGGAFVETADLSSLLEISFYRFAVGDLDGDGLRDVLALPLPLQGGQPHLFRND